MFVYPAVNETFIRKLTFKNTMLIAYYFCVLTLHA